jgi:hypothetical protein
MTETEPHEEKAAENAPDEEFAEIEPKLSKAKATKNPKRFRVIASGCQGLMFITIEDEGIPPKEFVTKILSDPDLKKCKAYIT